MLSTSGNQPAHTTHERVPPMRSLFSLLLTAAAVTGCINIHPQSPAEKDSGTTIVINVNNNYPPTAATENANGPDAGLTQDYSDVEHLPAGADLDDDFPPAGELPETVRPDADAGVEEIPDMMVPPPDDEEKPTCSAPAEENIDNDGVRGCFWALHLYWFANTTLVHNEPEGSVFWDYLSFGTAYIEGLLEDINQIDEFAFRVECFDQEANLIWQSHNRQPNLFPQNTPGVGETLLIPANLPINACFVDLTTYLNGREQWNSFYSVVDGEFETFKESGTLRYEWNRWSGEDERLTIARVVENPEEDQQWFVSAPLDTCENPLQYQPDQDQDGDHVLNQCDLCPSLADGWRQSGADADMDGVGNACDNCPNMYNPEQEDENHDGFGDACNDLWINFRWEDSNSLGCLLEGDCREVLFQAPELEYSQTVVDCVNDEEQIVNSAIYTFMGFEGGLPSNSNIGLYIPRDPSIEGCYVSEIGYCMEDMPCWSATDFVRDEETDEIIGTRRYGFLPYWIDGTYGGLPAGLRQRTIDTIEFWIPRNN